MADLQRVLLVDDSPDCRLLVTRSLQGEAHVVVATDVAGAFQQLKKQDFDLLLLDIDLPDGDGFEICSNLMADQGVNRPKVLFLTGSAKLSDKMTGFGIGADDYIVKPFEPLELKARVKAHLRSRGEMSEAAKVIKIGNLELNLDNYSVHIETDGGLSKPDLTTSEFRLLYHLAKVEGRVLSREVLLSVVSEDNLDVSDRMIDTHVSRIRKKLTGCTHSIEAIYGVGYRMIRVR